VSGAQTKQVILLKLGGSLITDKNESESVRVGVLERALRVIAKCRESLNARLIIAHGSGSFGHATAIREGFAKHAPASQARMLQAARIHESVLRLHQQVLLCGTSLGLPLWSLMPSSFVVDGAANGLESNAKRALLPLLSNDAIPLVCGDVVSHDHDGAAICSTEPLLLHLWKDVLRPAGYLARAIWAGVTDGLLDQRGNTIAQVDSVDALKWAGPSNAPDVTGGMTLRLGTALELAQVGCNSLLINGTRSEDIERALIDPNASLPFATRVVAPSHSS
jgi:isopentenyl phosphate kinase